MNKITSSLLAPDAKTARDLKPGDIFRFLNGTTVYIRTDRENMVTLAGGLTYPATAGKVVPLPVGASVTITAQAEDNCC